MTGTVLVTGGFGLVGSETVKQLAAAGRQVVVEMAGVEPASETLIQGLLQV